MKRRVSRVADRDLGGPASQEVAIPLRRTPEAGDDEHLLALTILANDLEHRLILASGSSPDMR